MSGRRPVVAMVVVMALVSAAQAASTAKAAAAPATSVAAPGPAPKAAPPVRVGTEAVREHPGPAASPPKPTSFENVVPPRTFPDDRAGARIGGGAEAVDFTLEHLHYGSPTHDGDTTTYAAARQPTVRYTSTATGVKEAIVLDRRPTAPLEFALKHPGLTLHPAPDGWVLRHGHEARYRVSAPFATDATGRRGSVDVAIHGSQWTLSLDRAFAASAAYPVTIDPSIDTVATPLATGHPNLHRTVALSDGTLAAAYWDGSAIRVRTATSPYRTWSSGLNVATGQEDFAIATDGANTLYVAYENAAQALAVVPVTRSGGTWTVGSPVVVESNPADAPALSYASGTLYLSLERYSPNVVDELHLATSTDGGAHWSTEVVKAFSGSGTQSAWSANTITAGLVGVVYNDTTGNLAWTTRPTSGGSWAAPTSLGAVVANHFSLANDGASTLDLVRQSCANCAVVFRQANSGTWGVDQQLAATSTDGPTVATDGTKVWAFYTRDLGYRQSQLFYRVYAGGTWGPESLWLANDLPFSAVYEHVVPTALNPAGQWNDRTSAAADTNTNDVAFARNLNDELYLGLTTPFSFTRFVLGTAGNLSAGPAFSYWNGTAWVALSVTDNTAGFTRTNGTLSWSAPADWATTTVNGSAPLYYVRVTRTAPVLVQAPVGTQITPAPYIVGLNSLERGSGLLPELWSQATADDASYAVTFDAVDLAPPSVSLTAPAPGLVSGTVTPTASATDNYSGVAAVKFFFRNVFADGTAGPWNLMGTSTAAPFQLTWRTTSVGDGPIDLTVSAVDNQGNDSGYASATRFDVENGQVFGLPPFDASVSRPAGDSVTKSVDPYWGDLRLAVTGSRVDAAGPPERVALVYDSRNRSRTVAGYGWTLAAVDRLEFSGNGVVLDATGDGGRYRFTPKTGGGFNHPPGVFLTLNQLGDGTYNVTDKAGTVTHFSSGGKVLSVQDLNGRTRSYTYDANGRLTQIANPAGNDTVAYDAAGRLASMTDAANHTTTLSYDAASNVSGITDPLGRTYGFAYDADHRMTSFTDARGGVHPIGYSGVWGLVSTLGEPTGASVAFDYGTVAAPQGRSVTDENAKVSGYVCDTNGAPTSFTDANGYTTTYARDGDNNVTTTTSPLNEVTRATYDASGNPLTRTDANGHVTTMAYNSLNEVTSQTDALNNTTTYTYDSAGRVLSKTTPLSHVTTYAYDASGNRTSTTDALNNTTTMTYDAAGRVLTTRTPLGNTTTDAYDAAGDRTSSTDPLSHTTSYSFDAVGHPLSTTDPLSHVTSTAYDAAGNATSETDALGHTTTKTYDANNRVLTTTTPAGHVTTNTYDPAGRLSTSTDPTGARTAYGYDAVGNKTSVTDALAHTSTATFDADNHLVAQIDGAGNKTTHAYDAVGNRTSSVEPLGNVSGANPATYRRTFTYDADDHTVSTTDPMGDKTTYAYDADGNKISEVDPRGNATGGNPAAYTTSTSYDALDRVSGRTVPSEGTTTYTYDADGRQTTVTDPTGAATTSGFDAAGRTVSLRNSNGATATYGYDAAGRRTSIVDPRGNVSGGNPAAYTTTIGYDAAGHTTSVTDPLAHTRTDTYDSEGNQVTTVDPRGNVSGLPSDYTTTITRDADGRNAGVVDALGRTEVYAYDGAGNVISQKAVDANQNAVATITYGYDAANRLTQTNYPNPSGVSPIAVTLGYDANSDPIRMTDPTGTSTAAYDAAARVTSATAPVPGSSTGGTYTDSYGFDAAGNVTSTSAPSGAFSYAWRADNRLATRTAGASTTSVGYDANGRATSVTDEAGRVDQATYDPAGQLSELQQRPSAGASPDGDWRLSYDAAGEPTQVSDASGNVVATRTWDAAGRLAAETYGGAGGPASVSYGYDEAGNRTQRSIGGGTTTYRYDHASQLSSSTDPSGVQTSYTYDRFGDLTQVVGPSPATYAWQFIGDGPRLSQATVGTNVVTFTYDGNGRRVTKKAGAVATNYRYDGQRLEAVTDTLGNTTASFSYSNSGVPFAIYLPGVGGFYYHYDAFGSVNRLTSTTGATAVSYQYDAYGNLVSTTQGPAWNAALSNNPFQFMGSIQAISDPALGLVTANGVPYSPSLGNPLTPPVSLAPRTRMAACNGNNGIFNWYCNPVGSAWWTVWYAGWWAGVGVAAAVGVMNAALNVTWWAARVAGGAVGGTLGLLGGLSPVRAEGDNGSGDTCQSGAVIEFSGVRETDTGRTYGRGDFVGYNDCGRFQMHFLFVDVVMNHDGYDPANPPPKSCDGTKEECTDTYQGGAWYCDDARQSAVELCRGQWRVDSENILQLPLGYVWGDFDHTKCEHYTSEYDELDCRFHGSFVL